MKKFVLALAVGAMTLPVAVPVQADPPPHAPAHGRRAQDRILDRDDRIWRDGDRFRCRRGDGTVGLVVGAGVGALVGRTIDTRGDRSAGTLLGAIGGGLLGREIDRGELRCR